MRPKLLRATRPTSRKVVREGKASAMEEAVANVAAPLGPRNGVAAAGDSAAVEARPSS